MRISGSGQSHDAAPLYWRGKQIPWPVEALLLLLINPLTILIVYPSLLIWSIWRAAGF